MCLLHSLTWIVLRLGRGDTISSNLTPGSRHLRDLGVNDAVRRARATVDWRVPTRIGKGRAVLGEAIIRNFKILDLEAFVQAPGPHRNRLNRRVAPTGEPKRRSVTAQSVVTTS